MKHNSAASLVVGIFLLLGATAAEPQEQVQIDARATTTLFPHFWEQMFGSGRAILSLRDSYRDDFPGNRCDGRRPMHRHDGNG